jgi:hypothetical protein
VCYSGTFTFFNITVFPCGGGLEYIRRSHASRRRRRKRNPMPRGIIGLPVSVHINVETWPTGLGVGRKSDDLAVRKNYCYKIQRSENRMV